MNDILKILWFGGPGQGIPEASSMLAKMIVSENKYVQALTRSHFVNRGEPIEALNRISDSPLRFPGKVYSGDVGIVLNPDLIHDRSIKNILKDDALYIVNSSGNLRLFQETYGLQENQVYLMDGSTISEEETGFPLAAYPALTILMNHFEFLTIARFKELFMEILSHTLSNETAESYIKTIDRVLNEVQKSWEE